MGFWKLPSLIIDFVTLISPISAAACQKIQACAPQKKSSSDSVLFSLFFRRLENIRLCGIPSEADSNRDWSIQCGGISCEGKASQGMSSSFQYKSSCQRILWDDSAPNSAYLLIWFRGSRRRAIHKAFITRLLLL